MRTADLLLFMCVLFFIFCFSLHGKKGSKVKKIPRRDYLVCLRKTLFKILLNTEERKARLMRTHRVVMRRRRRLRLELLALSISCKQHSRMLKEHNQSIQRTHCSSSAYDDVKGKKGSLGEKLYKKNGRVKAKTVMNWQDQGLNYPLELSSKYLYSTNCACTTPPTVTFIPEY